MINVDSAGNYDGNCVITDFGIGAKEDKDTGMAGTPGFASPEQLISDKVGMESDLYSLGRVAIFVFAEWKTAWTILYKPVEEISTLKLPTNDQRLLDVVRQLLTVCSTTKTYFLLDNFLLGRFNFPRILLSAKLVFIMKTLQFSLNLEVEFVSLI